jgi:hypothetical protein
MLHSTPTVLASSAEQLLCLAELLHRVSHPQQVNRLFVGLVDPADGSEHASFLGVPVSAATDPAQII